MSRPQCPVSRLPRICARIETLFMSDVRCNIDPHGQRQQERPLVTALRARSRMQLQIVLTAVQSMLQRTPRAAGLPAISHGPVLS